MDFLLALAVAVPPTPQAPGKGSSSGEAPTGIPARDFEALMSQADGRPGGQGPAMPLPGEELPSSWPAGSHSGDGTARAGQRAPKTHDDDVPDHPPDHVLRSASEQARAVADAIAEGVHATGASEDQPAAAIGPEIPADHERVEAGVTDRPDAVRPETAVAARAPGPEWPIPTPSPEQLLSPCDAPATGPRDQAQPPQPQAGPPSSGGVAVAPAVATGTELAIACQVPPQAVESGSAGGVGDTVGAPAVHAGTSSIAPAATGPSQEHRTPAGSDKIARAVEPRRSLAPTDGADGDDRRLVQEKPATQDATFGSLVRGTDPSGRQQPSSDVQPGRLLQTSALQGNAVAGAHAATGVTGAIAPVVTRAPDGVVSVNHGPHPASHQVALHITKALDQDRTEIRIRLDPPDLGEVDIQLEFRDLRLTASVSAERPDTVELLQRDSRALARALREAGLELADSDLSFAHNGHNDRPDAGSYAPRTIGLPRPLPAVAPLQDPPLALAGPDGFVSLSDGRMDLRV